MLIDDKLIKENKNIKVSSLYKALLLLEYFREPTVTELSATELAERSGLLVTSVHNIMSTFTEYGLIQKDALTHKYSLGKKFLVFSNLYSRQHPLQNHFVRIINNLAEQTGENVLFAVPFNTDVLYLESAMPHNSTNTTKIFGVTAPMYCTAIGKAVLACSDEKVIEETYRREKTAFTPNTITDNNRLREEIETIRERGYAIDDMEHEFGIKCVAIAIEYSDQIYGLSISGPSLRFTKEKIEQYAETLLQIKQSIVY